MKYELQTENKITFIWFDFMLFNRDFFLTRNQLKINNI